MKSLRHAVALILAVIGLSAATAAAQKAPNRDVYKWVTVTGVAAGTTLNAQDEAKQQALRQAVEEACGVFIKGQSKTQDYQAVYDKVMANSVGFVAEHKVLKTWTEDGKTYVKLKAKVSTHKFEEKWADIAHTVNQVGNPRVIIAIGETTYAPTTRWNTSEKAIKECGAVQTAMEDFFLEHDIELMDKATATDVSKRDILLASVKDDTNEVAALGVRFKADVVIVGQASAKFGGKELVVAGQKMYQYVAVLNVRAIQTDSARLIVSKTFGPYTVNTLQKGGGEDKALAKLAEEAPPKVLEAVVDAWRKKANVNRTVSLQVSGMDYGAFKPFKQELEKVRGVEAIRLREITQGVAAIEIEYRYTTQNLADRLLELKDTKLKITEFSANRLKAKVVE